MAIMIWLAVSTFLSTIPTQQKKLIKNIPLHITYQPDSKLPHHRQELGISYSDLPTKGGSYDIFPHNEKGITPNLTYF